MKSFIKGIASVIVLVGLLSVATFMVIKYFDVLAACWKRLKELFEEKKHLFFTSHCCDVGADDEDEECCCEEDEVIAAEPVM